MGSQLELSHKGKEEKNKTKLGNCKSRELDSFGGKQSLYAVGLKAAGC